MNYKLAGSIQWHPLLTPFPVKIYICVLNVHVAWPLIQILFILLGNEIIQERKSSHQDEDWLHFLFIVCEQTINRPDSLKLQIATVSHRNRERTPVV